MYVIIIIFRTMSDLINDLMFGAVLQPVLDLVGNSDMTANVLLSLAFNAEPSRQFPAASGLKVELLNKFVKTHQSSQNTALRVDMSTILKNETSLFAFMNFLKEKQAIDQLHFCLAVGRLTRLGGRTLKLYEFRCPGIQEFRGPRGHGT